MTIDERLERLVERHEALSQSVELLLESQRQTDEKIRHLAIIAEQNEVRAAHMQDSMTHMQDAITRLANVVVDHEGRIERLES